MHFLMPYVLYKNLCSRPKDYYTYSSGVRLSMSLIGQFKIKFSD